MRVFIPDAAVFENPAAFRSLHRLWTRVFRDHHELVVADAEAVLESEFAKQGVAPYERIEWEEQVRLGVLDLDYRERMEEPGQAPNRKHVMVVAAAQVPRSRQCLRTLSAEEVGDWAETPLRLLVENYVDHWLLLGTARVSKSSAEEMTWLEIAIQDKQLHVDGRGGCGEVWSTLREIPNLTSPDVRLFIMLDSDTSGEGADVVKAQQNVKRLVDELHLNTPQQAEVHFHLLTKREVENYVPRALLKSECSSTAAAKRAFRGWDKLTAKQQDYADIKKLFGKGPMKACMKAMSEGRTFTLADLKQRAGEELSELLDALQERL
ncbi:MAG: hypothetical protein IPN01_07915 [Deltaproteobacteria bacterium]|nr:hypothetical protein [Deltaproteobacteria bacterium]